MADKLAGIAVHPGTKTPWGRSLIDLFTATARSEDPKAPEPKLVHRLDKDTSGLILIAKNDATLRKLTELIRKGKIEKKYLALIKGKLSKQKGEIRLKLLRTEGSKFTKIRVSDEAEAKESVTHYEVQSYFPDLNASLLEVRLETGRMHQIRVHFASLGHPLAGDEAYGDFAWNRELAKKYGSENDTFRMPVPWLFAIPKPENTWNSLRTFLPTSKKYCHAPKISVRLFWLWALSSAG